MFKAGRTTLAMALLSSFLLGVGRGAEAESSSRVRTMRVPNGGIQPQVAVDHDGAVHLIYFKGEAGHGDIFYVRSTDGGATFSQPIQVNSHGGSAIAAGNIRGAHIAVGKNVRVHVAWMGSEKAEPKAPNGESPMLYARLDDTGRAFEQERNVIQARPGLDGGGSIAADGAGNVYVAWHAPDSGARGEGNRRIWVARSTDDGKTFDRETAAYKEATGACGCCGMRALADQKGTLYVLYRSATETVNRDMYLLTSKDKGIGFSGTKVDEWQVGQCVMSTAMLFRGTDEVLAAWETRGQVFWARINTSTLKMSRPLPAPGAGKGRKHPVVAENTRGEVILAWTEGMGWQKGGAVAWQVFDKAGRPVAREQGRAEGVPVWSLVAVFARADGGFGIIY
jgi:hypothetical protein